MRRELSQAAEEVERSASVPQFWSRFEAAMRREGFDFVLYVLQDEDGRVRSHANFPLYEHHAPEDDPFLAYCCQSYEIILTGAEFLDRHGYLPEAARQVILSAGAAGFRSGFGLPVVLDTGGARGGFNLGTRLPRARFLERMRPRAEDLHAFCLLAHRRLEVLQRSQPEAETSGLATLSEREREVLALLAQGMTKPRVAARLGISSHTVSSHAKAIYRKLGVRSQVEAVRLLLDRPD